MNTNLDFSFTQTLQTAYPGLNATVSFWGKAIMISGSFAIKNITGKVVDRFHPLEILQGFDDLETLEMQQAATGDMGRFLALCRNSAHQEATERGWFDTVRPNLHKPIMRQEMSEL